MVHLGIAIILIAAQTLVSTHSHPFIATFTRVMTNMTLDTFKIYQDCYHGKIDNVSIYTQYAFERGTFCLLSVNPFIPVEFTRSVEKLTTYGDRVTDRYGACIANRNCSEEIIDMTEWKSLAKQEYKACKYCDSEDPQSQSSASSSACETYVSESLPENVEHILNSMFLYVQFQCTIEPHLDEEHQVIEAPVFSYSRSSTIKLSRSNTECQPNQAIAVDYVVEQASDLRYQVKETNQQLTERIHDFLNTLKPARSYLSIRNEEFAINGGYYWGSDEGRRVQPICLFIHYRCHTLPPIILPTTSKESYRAAARTGKLNVKIEKEATMVVVAGVIVSVIFILVVVAVTLTIRTMRKGKPMINTIM